jgi:hypothetical protein
VKWVDPYRKPAYLFALVAGKLVAARDKFTTQRGREVTLEIWTEPADQDKVAFGMGAVKRAMKWDEERFGLEYDLDIYMIVAVSDFNMGAMENKGLNIFNTSAVLARKDTRTDAEFQRVEAIIAHEYFHNWTGNRVTCRDWFQLSLKEGLTVFRDQEFSSDLGSRAVKRIDDVKSLRALQFPEDAGPTAHPIRPDSYIEMNNFYTMTVYEKGPKWYACITPCWASKASAKAWIFTSSDMMVRQLPAMISALPWRMPMVWIWSNLPCGIARQARRCCRSVANTMPPHSAMRSRSSSPAAPWPACRHRKPCTYRWHWAW